MDNFLIGVAIILTIGLSTVGFVDIITHWDYYEISVDEWKCQKAIIIDHDPSKTECVNYIKKEK